jgi:hypothetical protein
MNEAQTQREMPQFRCHKVVHALPIAAIAKADEDGREAVTIVPQDPEFAAFEAPDGWRDRCRATIEDAGVYVVYEDGYASWSPTKAFEEGYTPIEAGEATGEAERAPALRADHELVNVTGTPSSAIVTRAPERSEGGAAMEYATHLDRCDPTAVLRFPPHPEANVTNEALLCVVEDRLMQFQNGPHPHAQNAVAITSIRQALAALRERHATTEAGPPMA